MSLAAKLTGLFLLLALLPLAVVAWLAYDSGSKSIEEDTRDALMSVAILKSAELERWMERNAQQLRSLAQRPLVRQYASAVAEVHVTDPEHEAIHTSLLDDHLRPALAIGATKFVELFILGAADGVIHISTDPENVGKYREDRAYFTEGKRETYVQNAYFSVTGQDVRVSVGTPITDANGDTIAVLAGYLDLEELAGIVETQSGLGASEDTYLVNKFNFFVTEPLRRKDAVLKAAIHTDGVADCLEGNTGAGSYLDYRGTPVLGAYRWLPERELCILTEMDRGEALAPVTSLARRAAATGGLAALAAALLAVLFARTITAPVRLLAAGAREIGRGNLNVRVRTKGKDEIAELSRTLDLMASDLKMTMASRDELEEEVSQRRRAEAELARESRERAMLAEIGRVISWSPRVDEAYGELARLARTLVPCDRVAVARWDRQENVLVQEFSTGTEVPGAGPGTVVSLGRLDIEELYPDRKARIFDRDAFALIAEESGIPVDALATSLSSAMSVPLVSRDEVIGNLTFRSAESDAYDDEDLVLADQIAGQVAGAIANSQLVDMLTESLGRLSAEVAERTRAEEGLRELTEQLEDRVALRTIELEVANKDLEAFAYSVSHDLRAPLRAIEGFSGILEQEHSRELSAEPRRYLRLVGENVREMVLLIDDMLALSRLGRQALELQLVEPADIARQALADLGDEQKGRRVEVHIGDLPSCRADPGLLRQVFANVLSNALKFTRSRAVAEIEVGSSVEGGEVVYFVRDNGVGFDMEYADRVFGVFQRLHRAEEYEGTGVGLAIVQRIIRRHEGRVWVEAKVDQGATFSFVLGGGATDE